MPLWSRCFQSGLGRQSIIGVDEIFDTGPAYSGGKYELMLGT